MRRRCEHRTLKNESSPRLLFVVTAFIDDMYETSFESPLSALLALRLASKEFAYTECKRDQLCATVDTRAKARTIANESVDADVVELDLDVADVLILKARQPGRLRNSRLDVPEQYRLHRPRR